MAVILILGFFILLMMATMVFTGGAFGVTGFFLGSMTLVIAAVALVASMRLMEPRDEA